MAATESPAEAHARWRALVPDLTDPAIERLEDLVAEIERWNRRIKLTAPGTPEVLRRRLVEDSLVLVPFLRGPVVVDVGSGPGIPGLVLAIAREGIEVRTVEAIAKKVAFTRSFLARHPTLRVRPFQGRAGGSPDEPWAGGDTVLSRALTAPVEWVRLGGPLVAPGGRLLVTLGAGTGTDADPEAARLGFRPAGQWSGQVGGVPRALRWYDRVG